MHDNFDSANWTITPCSTQIQKYAYHQTGMVSKKIIVIGGSIMGLLAAHVLSDHFEDIVLIEKDKFSEDVGQLIANYVKK
jgi:heterodisulfide reductase subunit A-like polyferredoxin